LLHELAQPPFQFYWLRALIRFYNKLPLADSPLLSQVAAADATLSFTQHGTWSYQLRTALSQLDGLRPHDPTQPLQASGLHYKIDETAVLQAWLNKWHSRWHSLSGDPRDPNIPHRPGVTYNEWFKQGAGFQWADVPSYLGKDHLSRDVWQSVARFRLGCSGLSVETGRRCSIPFSERHCPLCWVHGHVLHQTAVEDARHVVFECHALDTFRTGGRFTSLFVTDDLRSFFNSPTAYHFLSQVLAYRAKWYELGPSGPAADVPADDLL
jgi:hypothetical protein